MNKASLTIVVLVLGWAYFCSSCVAADVGTHLGKSQAETKPDYLVGMSNFSTSKPLSPKRIMRLVIDLGRWGDFPKKYKGGTPFGTVVPGCDDYISTLERSSLCL